MIQSHWNVDSDALETILRWPTAESKSWTQKLLGSAQIDDNIRAIVAVGSAVRSNVPSVDVDLVVLASDPGKLKLKPPIEIDLRAYPMDQVDALIEGGNDLLGWSVNYGKVLLQKAATWDRVLERWRDRVPLPSVQIADNRAADAFRRFNKMLEIGDQDAAYEQAVSYVTHVARGELIRNGRYPTSRPELPQELRSVGSTALADALEALIKRTVSNPNETVQLVSRLHH